MSRREYFKEENRIKKIAVVFSVVLAMTIVAFGFVFNLYNKKLRESARDSLLELGSINAVVPNQIQIENETLEQASTTQDKGINEVANETVVSKHDVEKIENNLDNENTVSEENLANEEISEENQTEETKTEDGQNAINDMQTVQNFEPSFVAPISGEIIKDFASDSLVYSKTLDEWTTHYGIDIRADKMSVVASSEAGTVESIKNDPRYGLTITISHPDGYKTIYSNLLSSEFVKEGDVVESGQTIGTVGESASFEVSDDPHLHFEIMKDGEYLNPTLYLR